MKSIRLLGVFPFLPAAALSVLGAALGAQGPAWTFVASPTAPINRSEHAVAYDAARQRTMLFGGRNTNPLGDTWQWDGQAWSSVQPTPSPSARYGHAMAYDAARQRIVLFGGFVAGPSSNPTPVAVADTWEWNGVTWQSLGGLAGPSARGRHAMVYDAARQRVVLFGGASGPTSTTRFADTWEWDGVNWTPRLTSVFPAARSGHAMAYDSVRQCCVLFGGDVGAGNDTWSWNGQAWTQYAAATAPTARKGHAMAFDAARQRVVVQGGEWNSSILGDAWDWDGSTWQLLSASASNMTRTGSAMAFDANLGCTMLFGGLRSNLLWLADTWVFGGTPATAIAYGSGCGAPPLAVQGESQGRPILGNTASVVVTNPPSPLIVVAAGVSRTTAGAFQLPLPLGGFGMTGCFMHQSGDVLGLGTVPVQNGGLRFALAIPAVSSLVGSRLYLQAYGYAPAANPLEVVVSNGLDWKIGNL